MLKEERIRFIVPEARRRAKCSKDTDFGNKSGLLRAASATKHR